MINKFLDIDMDFFLKKKPNWEYISSNERLDGSIFKSWSEQEFRTFIETKLNLRKDMKTKGRIVKNHVEAFYFWEELINNSSFGHDK